MYRAVITIRQCKDKLKLDFKTFSNEKEQMLGVEAHVLGAVVARHLSNGTFNQELALEMRAFNGEEDE